MKQTLLLIVFMCASLLFGKGQLDKSVFPGKAVIKIKPEYKSELNIQSHSTGIAALDSKLASIPLTHVKNYYIFNPKKYQPGLPDLSLILELGFDTELDPQVVINLFHGDKHIEYAEAVMIDNVFATPNDPSFSTSQLYFTALQAEAAWDLHKGENGTQEVLIAIVDTGVNWKGSDSAANIWNNLGEDANGNGYTIYYNGSAWVYDASDLNGIDDDGNGYIDDLIGWDFMLNANGDMNYDPYEASGHGTTVNSYANPVTNNALGGAGIPWNVKTLPVSCSYPGSSSVFRGYNAIIYAAEQGADVINCSWGGSSYSQASHDAINYAFGLGSLIVGAAGNSNNQTPIYPSAYPNVISTAALNNDGSKSSSSSFGAFVDVGAPNQTASGSGPTSYAAPLTSGLAALLISYHPTWTQSQIINQIIGSCINVDGMNAGKENMLGQGMLNALNALSAVDPLIDQELRLELFKVLTPTDANANGAVEQSEQFSLNLRMRNYGVGISAAGAIFTLSSSDPMVNILNNNHVADIPADNFFDLLSAFTVVVSPTATSKYVNFTLSINADKPIVLGATHSFSILINAGGYFVWEGKASARNMSGAYIRSRLQAMGKQVTYGTVFPASFYTFSGVFLSFGTVGSDIVRFNDPQMFSALKDYLLDGGRVYIEGGDVVGFDMGYYLSNIEGGLSAAQVLHPLLGISATEDGGTWAIQNLSAIDAWHTAPLLFTASAQTQNQFIDKFSPASNGVVSFTETGYGNVAVESIGVYGQRSFVFSYALRELTDAVAPHTRAELVSRIVDFFERSSFTLPDLRELSIEAISDNQVRLSWEYPFAVDSFRVYADPDPDGLYDTMVYDGNLNEVLIDVDPENKLFFKVIAQKNF